MLLALSLAVGFSLVAIVIIAVIVIPIPPLQSQSPPPIITAQISMDSDWGILTINATFSNINKTMMQDANVNWYSNYTINNATEEFPNGTITIPVKSYVQKQIQIDCQQSLIYLGKSNYYYAC